MNTRKLRKTLLTLCSALLLVSLSVGMTIAYLTDTTDVVENTFTVGQVHIKLDEAEYVDGALTGGRTEEGNEYHLMPGLTYPKDPTVTVLANSEDSYVRLRVNLVNIQPVIDAYTAAGKEFLPQYCVNGWDDATWLYQTYTVDGANAEVVFWYKEVVPSATTDTVLDALFDEIKVDGEVFDEDNLSILGDVTIQIQADAIQAAGFTTAAEAWEAFDEQN